MRLDVICIALHRARQFPPTSRRIAGLSGVAQCSKRQGCAACAGAMTFWDSLIVALSPTNSSLAALGCPGQKSF